MRRRQLLAGLAATGALTLTAIDPRIAKAMNAAANATNLQWWVRTSLEGVPDDFRHFWETRGGLAIFGWPISTLGQQQLEDGNTYTVMYFERARFERKVHGVELGQFGRHVLAEAIGGGGAPGNCQGNVGSHLAQPQPGPFGQAFNLPRNPHLESLPSMTWDQAPWNQWFHPLFKPELFNAANGWGGAYSWYGTFCSLVAKGGHWRHWGNPGQWTFYHTQQDTVFQLAILTTAQYLPQFLAGKPGPAQLNIRTAPGASVSCVGPAGDIRVTVRASDMGDVSINLPAECRVTISCASRIHDYNGETILWMGPTGRTCDINLIDGPQYQW